MADIQWRHKLTWNPWEPLGTPVPPGLSEALAPPKVELGVPCGGAAGRGSEALAFGRCGHWDLTWLVSRRARHGLASRPQPLLTDRRQEVLGTAERCCVPKPALLEAACGAQEPGPGDTSSR